MYDMRPARAKKTSWVVKVKWGVKCEECWEKIRLSCERESIYTPSFTDLEFFIPVQNFDFKCPHKPLSPYLFESVYGPRRVEA